MKKARQILAASLAAASLVLILWSAAEGMRYPCPIDESALAPPCQSILEFFVPVLVAFTFWAIGLLVWLIAQRILPLAFFALVANILALGMLAGTGASGEDNPRVFQVLLACAIPLTWRFHHSLPDRPPRRAGRAVSVILYGLAAAFSLPFLFDTDIQANTPEYMILRASIRLGLVAALALGWLLLFWNYRFASPLVRGRIRLVTFGTLFAFAPLVLLSLLPETAGAQYYVPYELTIPWLTLSPLAYVYSLFGHRFVRAEFALNRAGVYYLLLTLFLGAYLILAAVLTRIAANWRDQWFLVSGALSTLLLLLFAPAKRVVEKLMSWVLYGGEITYISVVGRLADSLSTTLDRRALVNLLLVELPTAMRLDKVGLFLKGDDKVLALAGGIGLERVGEAARMPSEGVLVTFLATGAVPTPLHNSSLIPHPSSFAFSLRPRVKLKPAGSKPISDTRLRHVLANASLGAEERALLSINELEYWVPLISNNELQGLLLVGPRSEAESFSAEDERILATLSRQAGIAIHNARLVDQVRASREELVGAHQQMLARVERERRQLALELHDVAVQQLLGISYQINEQENVARQGFTPDPSTNGHAHAEALEMIRCELVDVTAQLRGLIHELRPPELEDLGIAAAIEGQVDRFMRESVNPLPDIRLDLDPLQLDSKSSICLFRAAQEALRNALNHAEAQQIRVSLHARDEIAELVVEDDGRGFRVPARLSELARGDHYGLVGIAERIAWVGGEIAIDSRPGSGTRVYVCTPLYPLEEDHGSSDSSTLGG